MLNTHITNYINKDELFVLFLSAVGWIVEKTAHDKQPPKPGTFPRPALHAVACLGQVWRYLSNMGIKMYSCMQKAEHYYKIFIEQLGTFGKVKYPELDVKCWRCQLYIWNLLHNECPEISEFEQEFWKLLNKHLIC